MTPVLVSYLRTGLAAAVGSSQIDPAAGRAPLKVRATASSPGGKLIEGEPAGMSIAGPGDVVALNAAQVVARHPAPDAPDAPPESLAWIELRRADLPWLFTPMAPDGDRLEPWLCLLVLREDRVALIEGQPTWRLEVADRSELPDLSHSHAWAHAQVTLASPPQAGRRLTEPDYRASIGEARSRILSPRRLEPNTRYVACLVPTFRGSVVAALGSAAGAPGSVLDPAWHMSVQGAAPGSKVVLPVYDHWRFGTGPEGGFADLVRRLKQPAGELRLGRRDLDATNPGGGAKAGTPAPVLRQDGVLEPDKPDAPVSAPVLSASIGALLDRTGQLGPPTYGRWHAAAKVADTGAPRWLQMLNLDPVRRIAAGLGTQVVQRHQEEFMAACWQQAGEVLRANQHRRLGEMATAAAVSLRERRLRPLLEGTTSGLGLVAFVAPALARIRYGAGLSFRGAMSGCCITPVAVSPATQKLLRPNGPLQRRIGRRLDADLPRPIAMEETISRLHERANDQGVPPASAARTQVVRTLLGTAAAGDNRLRKVIDDFEAAVAGAAPAGCNELPGRDGSSYSQLLWQAIDPGQTVPRKVRRRIAVPNALTTAFDGLRPILVAPRLPAAMLDYLLDLSQDWLIPGLGELPPESLVLLRPNLAFIEAYFAGLNHEMSRELLWRGFPTDQRGTVFDSFWRHDDRIVPPLHTWRADLGGHAVPALRDLTVLVMRGELVRRFPAATAYLIAAGPQGPEAATQVLPVFSMILPPDIRLLGFPRSADAIRSDYLVFQEEPQSLRFGPPRGANTLHVVPDAGERASTFARRCLRPPQRMYIPAATLLR